MKDAAFLIGKSQMPFRSGLGIDRQRLRNYDAVHADLRQSPVRPGLFLEQITRHIRIDLAMNVSGKCPRYTGWTDRAVAVDEAQPRQHRRAARPDDLADRPRLFLAAVIRLRRRINTQVKPGRIERRRIEQTLIEMVFWHTTIGREAEISREQESECGCRGRPLAKSDVAKRKLRD